LNSILSTGSVMLLARRISSRYHRLSLLFASCLRVADDDDDDDDGRGRASARNASGTGAGLGADAGLGAEAGLGGLCAGRV
jgi:hypothetical protein